MNSFLQTGATRHEYRLKGWLRVLYLLMGVAFTVGGGFFVFLACVNSESPFEVLIAVFFMGIGLYVLAYALRSRLVIDGARIEVRDAFREHTADLSEIEGFRTISSRNGTYMQLYLKEGRGKITVSQSFNTDDDYRAYFQQLTDLDARDRDLLLEEISHDTELGSTPEERLSALKQAKTWSIVAIVVAIAAAAGLIFGDAALHLPSAVVLALAPVAAFFLMQHSPLLYAIFKKKSDPRAELSFVLMIASFGLYFYIHDLHFVSMQPLLLMIVIVAFAYIAAFFNSARKNSSPTGALIGLIFFGAIYSYGLAIVVNSLADNTKASIYIVPVTGKHVVHGKSTTYYLDLAPWGPVEDPNKISVSSSFYDNTAVDDQICLGLHPGRLRASWYQLAACPAPANSQPVQ